MATIELSMIGKKPQKFPIKDKDGNTIREEQRMVPVETTTFQLEADDSALQAMGSAMYGAPKDAEWYKPTVRDSAVVAITVGTLAAGGHGLMGETVQGVIHSIFGAKK